MGQQTRNHSVAGVALLAGAAMIAFGATQAWATGATPLVGRMAGLAPDGSLGFDLLLGPGGQLGDVKPLLLGGAAVLAVSALLLFLTRVPVLGVLWRLLALATVGGLGLASAAAWSVVKNPTSVLADGEWPVGQVHGMGTSVAQSFGVLDIQPGRGLWLLTIGCGVAGIGALIPAMRGRTVEVDPSGPTGLRRAPTELPPGWYPDQLDRGLVRFFDGAKWTPATRPRG